MTTLNINQLRSAIQKYLDDDGTRWSVGSTSTLMLSMEVDRAIWFSLQQASRFYVKNGGDGLLVQREIQTDTSGQAELGTAKDVEPLFISNVCISDGTGPAPHWAICKSTRADEVEYPDNTVRTLRINYVPKPFIDITNGNVVLYGDSSVVNPMALEELIILIILYSTRSLLPKDNEQNMALNDAIFQAEAAIGATIDTPAAVEFPRYGMSQQVMEQYRWAFIPFDHATGKRNVIQIHRPLYSFYDVIL